jgi:phosphoribosylformylglycinamidine synthase
VSLYNESEAGAIAPTPVIGMVGLLEDYERRLAAGLREEGDFVVLVGRTGADLGASEYLATVHGRSEGRAPAVDVAQELAAQQLVLDAAAAGLLRSCHDVAEGGLLVALAESCLLGGLGVRCPELRLEEGERLDAAFFAETQGRFIVSAPSRAMPQLQTLARSHKVEIQLLGMAGGDVLEFEGQLRVGLADLREAWEGGLAG